MQTFKTGDASNYRELVFYYHLCSDIPLKNIKKKNEIYIFKRIFFTFTTPPQRAAAFLFCFEIRCKKLSRRCVDLILDSGRKVMMGIIIIIIIKKRHDKKKKLVRFLRRSRIKSAIDLSNFIILLVVYLLLLTFLLGFSNTAGNFPFKFRIRFPPLFLQTNKQNDDK